MTITGLALGGADAGNYVLASTTATATANITGTSAPDIPSTPAGPPNTGTPQSYFLLHAAGLANILNISQSQAEAILQSLQTGGGTEGGTGGEGGPNMQSVFVNASLKFVPGGTVAGSFVPASFQTIWPFYFTFQNSAINLNPGQGN